MFDGYLSIGGVELLNRARAHAYITALLAGKIDVRCDTAGLRTALGHAAYTTPAADNAPWHRAARPATGRFAGLFPGSFQGVENSTHSVEVTELSAGGAVMTSPRYGPKEIRFVATALAQDETAMEEGLAWVRDILDGRSSAGIGCTGRELGMFAAKPTTTAEAAALSRTFYRADVTESLQVTRKFPVNGFVMWQVEFTVTAGLPWAFTKVTPVGTLAMDTALNFQDPAGEDCSAVNDDAYNDFVDDPFFTGITRPPRAPVILPPNIITLTSWRRKTLAIPVSTSGRWGRVAPIVQVNTETAVQFLRVRFYRASAGVSGCDFDGEFLVSYIPAGATLTLDSILREATLTLSDGRVVPAGHLLFGSGGRPFLWPSLGGQDTYTMTADLMPDQTGVVVLLDTAVRE